MKNILVLITAISIFGGSEVSAQGLRGCLGGVGGPGCDYAAHMDTQQDLHMKLIKDQVLKVYKEKLLWFGTQGKKPKTKEAIAQDLAAQIVNALTDEVFGKHGEEL